MRTELTKSTIALIVTGLALAATPVIGGPLQDLQVIGSGTVETNCLATLVPGCTITTRGTATGTADGTPVLDGTFAIRVDLGTAAATNGWPASWQLQGICLPGAYLGTLTAANGDTLNFSTVGTVCEEATTGSPYHINGTFRITSGTGQFAAAAGGGSFAITNTRTDATVFLKMSGAFSY